MIQLRAATTILLLAWAWSAAAQEAKVSNRLAVQVTEARREVATLARTLEPTLSALMPDLLGWSCDVRVPGGEPGVLVLIPVQSFECVTGDQLFQVALILNPSGARIHCETVDRKKRDIANGSIARPDLFRVFEGNGWKILRSGLRVSACAFDIVTLSASGNYTQAAIDQGYASIDAFAEALLNIDQREVASLTAPYTDALEILMTRLNAQSRALADLLPRPDGATVMVTLPEDARRAGLDDLTVLGDSPSASADVTLGTCSLQLSITGGPMSIEDNRLSGLQWSAPNAPHGTVLYAFRSLNTARIQGIERVDETGIHAFVDNTILVKVHTHDRKGCESQPGIVRRLFEEIIAADPAAILYP